MIVSGVECFEEARVYRLSPEKSVVTLLPRNSKWRAARYLCKLMLCEVSGVGDLKIAEQIDDKRLWTKALLGMDCTETSTSNNASIQLLSIAVGAHLSILIVLCLGTLNFGITEVVEYYSKCTKIRYKEKDNELEHIKVERTEMRREMHWRADSFTPMQFWDPALKHAQCFTSSIIL